MNINLIVLVKRINKYHTFDLRRGKMVFLTKKKLSKFFSDLRTFILDEQSFFAEALN